MAYNVLVASSGGDFTTLQAAINAATNVGQTDPEVTISVANGADFGPGATGSITVPAHGDASPGGVREQWSNGDGFFRIVAVDGDEHGGFWPAAVADASYVSGGWSVRCPNLQVEGLCLYIEGKGGGGHRLLTLSTATSGAGVNPNRAVFRRCLLRVHNPDQMSGVLFNQANVTSDTALDLLSTFENCVFMATGNCDAFTQTNSLFAGGTVSGVLSGNTAAVIFRNCLFYENCTPKGSGPKLERLVKYNATSTANPCSFTSYNCIYHGEHVDYTLDVDADGVTTYGSHNASSDLMAKSEFASDPYALVNVDASDFVMDASDLDFRSRWDSIGDNAGNSAMAPSDDMLGNSRPFGPRVDIGPNEHTPLTNPSSSLSGSVDDRGIRIFDNRNSFAKRVQITCTSSQGLNVIALGMNNDNPYPMAENEVLDIESDDLGSIGIAAPGSTNTSAKWLVNKN